MKMDALIISVKESQLDRCLESVRKQKVPFVNVIHLDSVVPESEAHNQGIRQVKSEWFVKIDGDMVLYDNATEIMVKKMENDPKTCGHYFMLRDTFLAVNMGYCGLLRAEAFKSEIQRDRLADHGDVVKRLREKGWSTKKYYDLVGTHFDRPNEFEVFKRFYCAGVRSDRNDFNVRTMESLLKKTDDPLYHVGLNAIRFSKMNQKDYPGSRNLDYDKKLYEEFVEMGF